MRALIDADGIIFACGFAVEHSHYLVYEPDDGWLPSHQFSDKKSLNSFLEDNKEENYVIEKVEEVEPLENALHLVKQKIISTLEAVAANEYNIYIKGEGNFRDEIAVTRPYKGNRDLTHRPKYEKEIRDYLINVWNAELVNGMEVDDRVAIEQWYDLYHRYPSKTTKAGADTIICSPDKDLDQIPGWHYNYNTGEKYWIEEDEALRNLYIQILAGDPSDNIVGVPKIGRKTADKLLGEAKKEEDLYRICQNAYRIAYGEKGDELMNEMANLVYLKRSENDKWERPRKN